MTSATESALNSDTAFGFMDAHTASMQLYNPVLIENENENTMLYAILKEMRRSNRFDFSVAFVAPSALALLKQHLLDFTGTGRIVTGTYLGFNSPEVFRELLALDNIEVLIYPDHKGSFHAKGYIFEQDEITTAIVGSSNLTRGALLENKEWNLRFSAMPGGDITGQLKQAVDRQIRDAVPLTQEWLEEYHAQYVAPVRTPGSRLGGASADLDRFGRGEIIANSMQQEALESLSDLRNSGARRALVISATGTGKTILAALDVKSAAAKHMLFVVHREQILDRAMADFRRVLGGDSSDYCKFSGNEKRLDARYVFATVQSLARSDVLSAIQRDTFDYVLIDEVHRAGAETYRQIIEWFTPTFLLGMTATPERMDGFDIFQLFDYNVAYEIRLARALEDKMLVPFSYFGVTDYVNASGVTVEDSTDLAKLVATERVRHLVEKLTVYGHTGQVKGLMFCSRNDEARELSALLNEQRVNGRQLRTIALSGADSILARDQAVDRLEAGELDYIISVDVFNEGIDIPAVNQIVMLRQTKSAIIFTQQLGRGLRKCPGKDHLRVIDFIGNYKNNYLIPIALSGDSSLNKDVIRKRLIRADTAGTVAGVSSISFDRVSSKRVLDSLAAVSLNSLANLKRAFFDMSARIGTTPKLYDFARFDAIDPVVMATKEKNYWRFQYKVKAAPSGPSLSQEGYLNFLSGELLNGKRPHELVLLNALIQGERVTEKELANIYSRFGLDSSSALENTVVSILALSFFTQTRREAYGSQPLIDFHKGVYTLSAGFEAELNEDSFFTSEVEDLIRTGLFLSRHRYNGSGHLLVGERYSRSDVCRLLNWSSDQYSTMYGYKIDEMSGTCPIFVTYAKNVGISASTRYEDEFVDPQTLKWFTRSRRTLSSSEVVTITSGATKLHLFAKKDDAEGRDFYYLGPVHPRDARQETMHSDQGTSLDVVSMMLDLEIPLQPSLYSYFVQS